MKLGSVWREAYTLNPGGALERQSRKEDTVLVFGWGGCEALDLVCEIDLH